MLPNCRPLRLQSGLGAGADEATAFRQEARGLGRLRTGSGNAAYFLVDQAPAGRVGWRRGPPAGIRLVDGGRQAVVAARNLPRALHSEPRCIRLFLRNFPSAARVLYVFTEREPCSDGPRSCKRLLSVFLERRGARGIDTPVRYLAPYMNKGEVETAATIGLGRKPDDDEKKEVRAANRKWGQDASRQVQSGR